MERLINGSHLCDDPKYFEWWYFHFISEQGVAFNLVLHETDIFGLVKKPYVSMSLSVIEQEPRYDRLGLVKGSISRNSLYLRQSDGYFVESETDIKLFLPFASQTILEIVIEKQIVPLVFGNGVLYLNADNQRKSLWFAPVPWARFSGWLTWEGARIPLSGFCYHDHQWGNLPIWEFVTDWVWGHFGSATGAVVFFIIQTQTGEFLRRQALVFPGKDMVILEDVEASHFNQLLQIANPELFKGDFSVGGTKEGWLSGNIMPSNILRMRLGEKYGEFAATYLRWTASAVHPAFDQLLNGITEYLRIRKGGK